MPSPQPVAEASPQRSSAYVPAPMIAESPTRPGALSCVSPVDVAAATWPCASACHRAHRAHLCGQRLVAALVGDEILLPGAHAKKTLELVADQQVTIATQYDAAFAGKGLRPKAHQQHVRRILEHATRQADGVTHTCHRGRGAGAQQLALHDRGVELDRAGLIQMRTVASVERRIVFQDPHRGLDHIKGGLAGLQPLPTGLQRHGNAYSMRLDVTVRNVPGTTVYGKSVRHTDLRGRLRKWRAEG